MAKLATIRDDGWQLDCAETLHRGAPQTFWIPPVQRRRNLRPGDIVKLVFRIALRDERGQKLDEVERMWVIVRDRVDGYYRGELDNDPYCTDEIRAGLEVVFEPRHVIQIYDS